MRMVLSLRISHGLGGALYGFDDGGVGAAAAKMRRRRFVRESVLDLCNGRIGVLGEQFHGGNHHPALAVSALRNLSTPAGLGAAPHCAIPQPRRGPVNFSSLRSTNCKGVSGAADTTCFAPFTDSVSSFAMTLPPEQPDFNALRA